MIAMISVLVALLGLAETQYTHRVISPPTSGFYYHYNVPFLQPYPYYVRAGGQPLVVYSRVAAAEPSVYSALPESSLQSLDAPQVASTATVDEAGVVESSSGDSAAFYTTPVLVSHIPVAPHAQVSPLLALPPVLSQFRSQDALGAYHFAYSGGPSSRAETRDHFGVVRGAFNYIDPEGKVQSQKYIADTHGFRVAGTNLPVAPAAPHPLKVELPDPVEDTPEVKQAKAEFQKAFYQQVAAVEAAKKKA